MKATEEKNDKVGKTYLTVWVVLMLLLCATWGFSELNLHPFNLFIAMLIALSKMLIILAYFMHLRHSSKLVWVFAAAGFIWFFIFVDFTVSDYLTRTFTWTE